MEFVICFVYRHVCGGGTFSICATSAWILRFFNRKVNEFVPRSGNSTILAFRIQKNGFQKEFKSTPVQFIRVKFIRRSPGQIHPTDASAILGRCLPPLWFMGLIPSSLEQMPLLFTADASRLYDLGAWPPLCRADGFAIYGRFHCYLGLMPPVFMI